MMTESLVTSLILMALVSNSAMLFSKSMGGLESSRINDKVVTAIFADVSYLQQCASLYGLANPVNPNVVDWKCTDTPLSQVMPLGQLNYEPDEIVCFDNNLAKDLINSNILPDQFTNDDVPDGYVVTREINTDRNNHNLLSVSYMVNGDTDKTKTYTLPIPAQGWCP